MAKYQINYNRKMPDHRVPFDYRFLKQLKGPLDYWKCYVTGFNTNMSKYYHMHLVNVGIVFLTVYFCYAKWDLKEEDVRRNNPEYPAQHFIHQLKIGNTTPYDFILKKFANEGLKDQAFQEC